MSITIPDNAPALGGLWWGYNSPGYFIIVRVLERGKLYAQAEFEFKYSPVPDVAKALKHLRVEHDIPKLRSIYTTKDLFDLNPDDEQTIHVEPIADVFARNGLPLCAVSGDVTHGWQRLHDYLRDSPDGTPWLQFSPACRTIASTIPSLVQRDARPEDLEGPAHAAHALRFIVSARPAPAVLSTRKPEYAWGTVGWLRGLDSPPTGVLSRAR